MRKRHPGQSAGGMGQNNNRRPHQKYGKPQHGGQQRPRKNYSALREKYLNHAKDAMSSGDRVLAEYYLQHADHYYRMMVENQENRPRWNEQNNNNAEGQSGNENEQSSSGDSDNDSDSDHDEDISNNSSSLPAFLTRKVNTKSGENTPPPVPEWEEEPQ